MSTAVVLDHVGLCTADLPALTSSWERMGFQLSPLARQSGKRVPGGATELFGTANRCAFLEHGYIELLGLVEPGLFANGLDRFLARYTGAHICAFGIDETDENLARLRRGGLEVPGIAWLERPVGEGGPIARFARLPFPDAPEGRIQLVQHVTPELVWDRAWMGHRNGAVALDSAIFVAEDPAGTMARLSRLTGLPARPDPVAGFLLSLPGGPGAAGPFSPARETRVRVLPPEALARVLPGVVAPSLPCLAGVVIATDDGTRAAREVLAGLPLREAMGGVMVPPEAAGGAAVVFA